MTDPKRWLDAPGPLTLRQQSALRTEVRRPPPSSAQRAVWASLAARVPLATPELPRPALSARTMPGSATAQTKALLLALGAAVAVTVVLAIAIVPIHRSRTPASPSPLAPARVRSEVPDPAPVPGPAIVPFPELPASALAASREAPRPLRATPRVSAPSARASASPGTEAKAVAAARALLRANQTSAALSALSDIARSFPNGTLLQEREALTIEALVRTGATSEARARASAFLAKYPQSPYLRNVQGAAK